MQPDLTCSKGAHYVAMANPEKTEVFGMFNVDFSSLNPMREEKTDNGSII